MSSPRGAFHLLLTLLVLESSFGSTRFFVKLKNKPLEEFEAKSSHFRLLHYPQSETGTKIENEEQSDGKHIGSRNDKNHSFDETSTFNPSVLNKFLEEYANKLKSTTERNYKYPFRVAALEEKPLNFGENIEEHVEKGSTAFEDGTNSTSEDRHHAYLSDILKRNGYSSGLNFHEDRSGWVTLNAIPWSKSKISKWEASNPTSQRPWPEVKPEHMPITSVPLQSIYASTPAYNNNNKPWYNRPKPSWLENTDEKLSYSDRPKPNQSLKPYGDKYETNSNHAQIWPPEKPSSNRYPDNYQHSSDIITDEKLFNFPNSWDRPQITKPNYSLADRYTNKNEDDTNDLKTQNYPPKYDFHDDSPSYAQAIHSVVDRPHFSQYQYLNDHPPNHPSSGDGQWVLLSTNHGFSKSRQRSIKLDSHNPEVLKITNGTKVQNPRNNENDPPVPVMTSKRQVRLTVLPSVNGTNTTTSHGGLLEVERTFQTVEQSQKEYETSKKASLPTIWNKKPIRNTIVVGNPSHSAVLTAIGAGMLPATMAMMIPMMLGRKKRHIQNAAVEHTLTKAFYLDQGLRH